MGLEFRVNKDGSVEVRLADTMSFKTMRDIEAYLDQHRQAISFGDLGRIAAVLAASSRPGEVISKAVYIDKLIDAHYLRFPSAEAESAFNSAAAETASQIASMHGDVGAFHEYLIALSGEHSEN